MLTDCCLSMCGRGLTPRYSMPRFASAFSLCVLCVCLMARRLLSPGRKTLPDKRKSTARWERKAMGQASGLIAGLPQEGGPRWARDMGGLSRTAGEAT
jgi:hypothetical protein